MTTIEGVKMTNLGPKVEIGTVFGAPTTYAQLAAAFHVNAYDILVEVHRAKGTNRAALPDLYAAHFKHFNTHLVQNTIEAQAYQYWYYAHGGVDGIPKQWLPFLNWQIPEEVTLRLPRSATESHLLRVDEKSGSRILRSGVEHPDFARLRILSERLNTLANDLLSQVDGVRDKVLARAHDSVSYCLSAQRLLTIIYDAIPNTPSAWVTLHGVAHLDLLEALRKVSDRAVHLASTNPELFVSGPSLESRVDKILDELSDPANIAMLEGLLPFYDISEERDAWEQFEGALLVAGRAIVSSGKSERYLEEHYLPFLGELAERIDPNELVARASDSTLKNAIESGWKQLLPATHKSILASLGTVGGFASSTIGNSRGPTSLGVSLIMVAGPTSTQFLALRSLRLTRSGSLATGLCLRLVMRLAEFSSAHDLDQLFDAIDRSDLEKLKKINWSHKVMSGNGWAGAYALANLAVLLSQLSSDEELTLRRFVAVIQSGAQLAVPVAELAASLASQTGKGALAQQILADAGRLARFAAVVAFGLAIWSAADAAQKYLDKDKHLGLEDILNIVGAAGTMASVGGWMLLEVTAFGAGVTSTIMAFGSILAVAVMVVGVAYHKAIAISGAGSYIRACMDAFVDSQGGKALLKDTELRRAVEHFERMWSATKQRTLSLSSHQDQLFRFARFFSPDGCAMILEMNPSVVRALLTDR